MASQPLVWDDELKSLVNTAGEQFGEDIFRQAFDRALAEAKKRQVPLTPAAFRIGGLTDGQSVILGNVFYEALRTELRRLTRPH